MSSLPHTNSYYADSANDKRIRPQLTEDISCDVCVIGAGFSGLSTALHLAEKGFNVVVLEANQIGFGASGRNGGQIVHSYSRDIDFIEKHYGAQIGSGMGNMAFEGANIIRRIIKDYEIKCDLKPGGLFAACNKSQMKGLESRKKLWESYGNNNLELMDNTSVREHVGSDRYSGGLLDNSGGHFHPLNLALGEAAAIESLGGRIFETSKVTKVTEGDKPIVHTEKAQVTANFVMVAGNAYLGGLIPELQQKAMPCGTQVITTEPLSSELQKQLIPHDICVEDCNYLLDYFRLSGDGRLIYGGGVTYGEREPGAVTSLIMPKLLKTFPQLQGIKVDYEWSGNFLLTLMRLPQLGRIGNNIYYAQGYSGHGITSTHLAGHAIASAIQGQAEQFDIFSSLPQYPFPGGRLFRIPFTAMGAWYYNLRDKMGI